MSGRAATSVIRSASPAGQLNQDVKVGKAQAGVLPESGVELTYEGGVCVQQRAPCDLSAPSGKRLFDKPVKRSRHGDPWGIFVHVHQLSR